jgi:hypothetical protein
MGKASMKDPLPPAKQRTTPEEDELASMRKKLRGALPALAQPELRRDLWPDMLRRMEQPAVHVVWRVPWFDWALLAVAGAVLVFFPALIPALLYHL